jgi:hypothetical protein
MNEFLKPFIGQLSSCKVGKENDEYNWNKRMMNITGIRE